jgi:hypothetical protein
MFELRKMKFASGEPVNARLKSGVVMNSDIPCFVPMYPPQSSSPNRYYNTGGRKNKKKKNSPNKSRTNNNNAQNKTGKVKSNNNNGTRRNNGGKQKKANGLERPPLQKQEGPSSPNASKEKAPSQQVPPPTLGEEQFPALPTEESTINSTKVEVEKVPEHRPEDDLSYEELEKNRANSDSASTATTTSSSSSKQQAMGGYAAALLKTAPPKTQTMEKEKRPTKADKIEKKTESKGKESKFALPKEESTKAVETFEPVPVSVQPPSWGGGRSFADVLRKETATTVAAAP